MTNRSIHPESRPTQKGNQHSTSKGAARWVALFIIGVLALAVAIFMFANSSFFRQSASEEPQAQSAEEPEANDDDDAMPSTYSFELPEL